MWKNKIKKFFLSFILFLTFSTLILTNETDAVSNVNIEQIELNSSGATLKITSDKNINSVSLYAKDSNGKYIQFYKNTQSGYSEKIFSISSWRLSKETESEFKVVVTDEEGDIAEGTLKIDRLPQNIVTPTPSVSTQPTTSSTPSVSAQPTTSSTPSVSVSPSVSASPSEPVQTTNPTVTPSPTNTESNKIITKKIRGQNVKLLEGDKVYFLDTQDKPKNGKTVGSDAIIIESNGKFGLIDTSTSNMGTRVVAYLKDLGIKELEFVLITHCHSDHIGGYSKVNKEVKIKKLYIKDRTRYKSACKNAVALAKKSGTEVHYVNSTANKTITLGNFNFTLYNRSDVCKGNSNINENVNSLSALAKINGKTIYFAGDIQNDSSVKKYSENNTAKNVGKIDIYKVSHHSYNGNNTSTALKYLKPTYAIVTNSKKRPGTTEAAARIAKYVKTKNMYYTESGTVILNITTSGKISFTKMKADN